MTRETTRRISLAVALLVAAPWGCRVKAPALAGFSPSARPARIATAEPPPRPRYTAETKAIVGATVIRTDAEGVIADATVVIKGARIVAVGPRDTVAVPAGADVIDAGGKYVIPGLIDGHIHFFQSGGLYTRPDGLDLRSRAPYDKERQWIQDNLDDTFRRYIASGVTTVVDVGGPFWNFDVRARADKAHAAPRVFAAGPLIASYEPAALAAEDKPIVKVTSKEEALDLVRRQVERKADGIKIWYIVSKKTAAGLEAFYPVVEAVATAAHAAGLPLWVHATELETARKAIEAGADVLVHSIKDTEVDDAFIALARRRKVIYVPTLWVFSSYSTVYGKHFAPTAHEHRLGNPTVIGSLFDMHDVPDHLLGPRHRKAQAAGPPPPNAVALRNVARLQKAGLSNHQVLVSATLNGARMVGKDKELGSVSVGKLADLVLLEKNPLDDVAHAASIHLVIKGGRVHWPDELIRPCPADLAQMQLNAYNARDIDAFVSVYSPDVEVHDFPAKLVYRGREQLRRRYSAFFAKATKLHCTLVDRIVRGRFVIDHELVATGIPGRENIRAVAIYETSDRAIDRVWFLR